MADILLPFVAVSLAVILTPGPDTALTIRNTLAGGPPAGIYTAAGVASGQLVWALATSLGLVAILAASEILFTALRYVGAAYLTLLGGQSLWRAIGPRRRAAIGQSPLRAYRLRAGEAYLQGAISNLSNPKMLAFFASMLPQFIQPSAPSNSTPIMLGALFALMTLSWLSVCAAITSGALVSQRRPIAARAAEAVMGTALIGFAIRLATR